MPDEIEMQKRANYFDLKRDEFMALEEYLLSGLSDKDLGKAEGGMANINDMTGSISSPKRGYVDGPGSYAGDYIPGQNVSKIMEHLASIRFDREAFFKGVKEAGFTKANGSVDLKAFERHLNKKGLSMWKMKSQKMMNSVTNELNDMLGGKFYKNVKKYSQKSILENLASKFKGFRGKYAEMYSAFTKEKFWEDALNLQEKGDKKFGTKKAKEKLLWIVRQLKTKWPSISIGTTVTALSKYGFGKTLPVVGHLITTEMGSGELPKEGTQEYEELMQGLNEEDEKGLEVTVPLPTQEKETAPTERFKGGGMADIYDMTRPLGYALGGPAGMTEPERKDVEYSSIMKEFEDSKGPGEPGIGYKLLQKITGDQTIDPIWKAKQFIKEKILKRTPGDQGSASGMHPLVEFQEMYDQYILDGGDMSFKEFFDMIQIELDKMAGD